MTAKTTPARQYPHQRGDWTLPPAEKGVVVATDGSGATLDLGDNDPRYDIKTGILKWAVTARAEGGVAFHEAYLYQNPEGEYFIHGGLIFNDEYHEGVYMIVDEATALGLPVRDACQGN